MKHELRKAYVDFAESMGKGTAYFRMVENYSDRPREIYDFFAALYEKNSFLNVEPSDTPRIPKIIHQIWIGDRPIPALCKEYQKTWFEHHPDWEYRFWTNRDLEHYRFADENLEALFQKTTRMGERVDLLRYDIILQFGGVYADMDCKCLRPFDVLNHSYDFYSGLFRPLPERMAEHGVVVANGLIAAIPGHPIMTKAAALLMERWDDVDIPEDVIYSTAQRTFLVLTDAVMAAEQDNHINIVLPPTYLYPLVDVKLLDIVVRGVKDMFLSWRGPYSIIRHHSFMTHRSQREWMHDGFETIAFRSNMWIALQPELMLRWLKSKTFRSAKRALAGLRGSLRTWAFL